MRKALASPDAHAIVRAALMVCEARARYGPALESPAAVKDYLRLAIGRLSMRVFVCIYLDARHRVF